ncbi:MAG TPA: hypothetical protein VFA15_00370 [Nitrososphaera sp.]|jgi:hypothetical protein|nr:hypothetical protein [uncultured Nitrososphaera sp.]HZT34343.1 hypothetical protein [Nitrososphaera sp.]
MVNAETLAETILGSLEKTFGPVVFPALMDIIVEDYLGEMDARTAIIKRPDLFERAFVGMLGEPGKKILADICEGLCMEFLLDRNAAGLRTGDLAECMEIIPKS